MILRRIVVLVVLGVMISGLYGNKIESITKSYIDISNLRSGGDDWKILSAQEKEEIGRIQLHQDKWLMHFIHWRLLTKKNETISVKYVKEKMLSFWGPEMPFKIVGSGGKTTVSGHDVYYIDGTLYNGMVKTRFILWNCPKTKRQFISDCNINKRKGTPDNFLKIQYDIISIISCCDNSSKPGNLKETSYYNSGEYKLSFHKPEKWKTFHFTYKKWYPKGLSMTKGSLLTLITDSEKIIELHWTKRGEGVNKKTFESFLRNINNSNISRTKNMKTIMKVKEVRNIKKTNGYLDGEIDLEFSTTINGEEYIEKCISKAYLWKNKNMLFFLVAGMIAHDDIMGIKMDLSPTEKTFDDFIQKQVLPNVKVF
ncbi:hypothetical protein ACFLRB_03345 [Acidobacteriota bacterium]